MTKKFVNDFSMSLTPSEKSMKTAAELAHSLWSHWMKHYFSLKEPSEHYERWINLMHRSFDQLTEKEKDSDYKVGLEIALALDQREQSVWEEALKAVPKKRYSRSKEHEHPCYCGDGSCLAGAEVDSWNAARDSLLSARSKSLKE